LRFDVFEGHVKEADCHRIERPCQEEGQLEVARVQYDPAGDGRHAVRDPPYNRVQRAGETPLLSGHDAHEV